MSPLRDAPLRVLIIGAGFAGVGLAIRLKQRGIDDFVILERAGAVGGTWRDNSYPGAACDVPSHLYSFSFEPKFDWSRKFAPQAEILDYIQYCVDKHGLAPRIRLDTEVASADDVLAPPASPPAFLLLALSGLLAAPTAVAAAPPVAPTPVRTDSAASPLAVDSDAPVEPPAEPGHTLAPRHRVIYSNTISARLNPLGVEDRVLFMYQRRLWGRPGRLFEDTHIGIGPIINAAPSISRVGATLQVVPLALLHLRASYYYIGYFGTQEFKAHGFDSPSDEFGPDTIKARSEARQAIPLVGGGQAELSALLQAKLGPIAIRDEVTGFNNQIKLPGTNDVFYDLRHDLLLPGRGWFLGNDADLLYVAPRRHFTLGARATYFRVFYPEAVYEPGEPIIKGNNDHARVGPLFAYTFKDRPHRRFMRPTLFVMAQWWVKHRYRTGQEINQGLPLVVIGFSFTGDLWKRD